MTPAPYLPSLAHVIDLLVDVVCVVNADSEFVFVNAASEQVLGYTPEEMIGRPMTDFMHPDDRARTFAHVAQVVEGTAPPHFENRYRRKDGSVVHLMWTARHSPAAGVRVAVGRDVTGRRRAEAMQAALYAISEAAHTTADLDALFARIHGIVGGLLPARNFFVALCDTSGKMLSFPYFVDDHDARPPPLPVDGDTLSAEVVRSGQPLLIRPDQPATHSDTVRRVVARRPPGHPPLAWLGVPLAGQRGVIGALVVQSYTGEVTYGDSDTQLLQFVSTQVAAAIERKQLEAQLLHMARYDHLTDLPNRALFHDRVQNALARARRGLERLAVLFVDLDRFKDINDARGHAVGDQLLREVARRLSGSVRESDTVGRLGGDEFAVLLPGVGMPEDALAVAEKIRRALEQPFALGHGEASIAASIGVAMFPDHGEDEGGLLALADDAMYRAKREGGNRVQLAAARAGAAV